MGRKKRDISYLKPFCYYCDKTFDNEISLHQHQKSKHFTCQICQKKFSTVDSLKGHLATTHREQLSKIPHANANRESTDLKIFGMQGVPRQYIQEKMVMGAATFWKKFLAEKELLRKKEAKKEKQALKEMQKLQNMQRNQDHIRRQPGIVDQEEKFNPQPQSNKPLSFNLSFGKGVKQQKQVARGFEEED